MKAVPNNLCGYIVLLVNIFKWKFGWKVLLVIVSSFFWPFYSFTVVKYCSSHNDNLDNWFRFCSWLSFDRIVSMLWPSYSFAVVKYCSSHNDIFYNWFRFCSWLSFDRIVSAFWPSYSFTVVKYCSSHNFCFVGYTYKTTHLQTCYGTM